MMRMEPSRLCSSEQVSNGGPGGAQGVRIENRTPHNQFYYAVLEHADMDTIITAAVKDGARAGRGFSIEELKDAGFDPRMARKSGVPTDVWRKSKYTENIEKLKSILKSVKEASPGEKAPRKEKVQEAKVRVKTPAAKTGKASGPKRKKKQQRKGKQKKMRKK